MQFVPAVKIVREASYKVLSKRIIGPDSVAHILGPIFESLENEEIWVLALDSQRNIRAMQCVSRGVLSGALCDVRAVFRLAVMTNAAAIIVVHNHPSGNPTMSPEDKATCQQLVAAGSLLGIPVLDFMVVCSESTYSAASTFGLL